MTAYTCKRPRIHVVYDWQRRGWLRPSLNRFTIGVMYWWHQPSKTWLVSLL